MSGHTKTPWVAAPQFAARHGGGRTYIPILRPGNDPVPVAVVHRDVDGYGRGEGEANAAFIVKAVNNHEAMATVLKRLLKTIDSGSWRDGTHLSIAAHPAVDDARELLASVGRP